MNAITYYSKHVEKKLKVLFIDVHLQLHGIGTSQVILKPHVANFMSYSFCSAVIYEPSRIVHTMPFVTRYEALAETSNSSMGPLSGTDLTSHCTMNPL